MTIYFDPMTFIFNKSSEKKKRKQLRNQMPPAEVILWSSLQRRQVSGFKFRRQYGVGPYVLDFYCPEAKLAIEIDSDIHFQKNAFEYDRNRQESIEQLGIRFLRFTNLEIYKNFNGVLESITVAVRETEKQAGRQRK